MEESFVMEHRRPINHPNKKEAEKYFQTPDHQSCNPAFFELEKIYQQQEFIYLKSTWTGKAVPSLAFQKVNDKPNQSSTLPFRNRYFRSPHLSARM